MTVAKISLNCIFKDIFPNNITFLSRETGIFQVPITHDFLSHRYVSSNIPGVIAL